MKPAVRIRDDDYQRSSKDSEEDMISFKPDWMKGNEAKPSNTRDRQNEKWRGNSSDSRRTRPDTRDWNKGSSSTRDTRGWGDRGRGAERSNPLGFSSTQPKGRFVPPPMSRSQSAGALFSPKEGPSQTTLLFSKEHLPPVVKVPAPAPPVKPESAFKLNPESDFPSLQPSPSVEPGKKQNDARSRFLKSKSTNALLEQNGGRAMSNGSFLLGKASAQEATSPLAKSQAVEGDVNGPAGTSVDISVQDVPSQEEQADRPKKLKKIPSFSEKVVEAMTANQATAKPETTTNKEDEQVLMLVPSKPAPPRLIKSRSDRGHLLDHVRKPVAKPMPSKGAEPVLPPKPQPEVVQSSPAKTQLSDSVTKPRRPPPSPSVYRKATSEPQLLHLWKKDGVPGGRALAESSSSDDSKKEGNKNGRVVDKQLELRQQKRNLFLEQLRRREAIKNGEVLEEEGNGEQSTRQEEDEDNQNVNRFSEEAVVSFMKQLGWSEEEDEYLDEGLTEEELLSVHPLDTAQLSKQREMRKEILVQSLRQWQPPLNVKGAATNGA